MPKKPKKPVETTPIEQALKLNEQTAKTAARKASKELTTPQLPQELEPFFAQQSKHKYGTCWKCGDPRKTPGGLPGGLECYWCDRCKTYLTVRHSRKDPAKIPLQISKK